MTSHVSLKFMNKMTIVDFDGDLVPDFLYDKVDTNERALPVIPM